MDINSCKKLTERELQICDLCLKGFASNEIAGRFFISNVTVKRHISNIKMKLGAKTTLHLGAILFNYFGTYG